MKLTASLAPAQAQVEAGVVAKADQNIINQSQASASIRHTQEFKVYWSSGLLN